MPSEPDDETRLLASAIADQLVPEMRAYFSNGGGDLITAKVEQALREPLANIRNRVGDVYQHALSNHHRLDRMEDHQRKAEEAQRAAEARHDRRNNVVLAVIALVGMVGAPIATAIGPTIAVWVEAHPERAVLGAVLIVGLVAALWRWRNSD